LKIVRKALLVPLSVSVAASAGAATRDFKWDDLKEQGRVAAGTVLPPEPGSSDSRLEIGNRAPSPFTATVLTIDRPDIVGPRYGISGRIRYDKVEGVGYVEMWSYFPNGGQYFSRTLADQGPMMKLQGTSGWRSFVLPFDATGAPPPTRLVVNVVLQGRGTVYLGPLQLSEEQGGGRGGQAGQLSPTSVGAIGGSIVGGVGALIGVLTAVGRGRRFVIASAMALVALGGLLFVVGILTFASSSATSDGSSALLLLGFLASVVPLGLLPVIRKRYEEIELRTMRALDVGQR
jgi:hypothetical protein